jgi:hypothetical protein
VGRKRALRDSATAKREHPYERTSRELFEGTEGPEVASANVNPLPMPVPDHIRRLLNHYAARKLTFAFSFLLRAWLEREGVSVPEGLFRHDPFGPGAGGKASFEKLVLGSRVLFEHQRRICPNAASVEEVSAGIGAAMRLPASRNASSIAKKLLPEEYAKNKEAARKKVQEAFEIMKSLPAKIYGDFESKLTLNDLLDMLLTGTFPLGSKLSRNYLSPPPNGVR